MATKINPSTNIPTQQSTAQQWINWHEAARKRYGKKTANDLFLEAWAKRGSSKANTVELRNYLEREGIAIEGNVFTYVADKMDDYSDFLSGTWGFTKTVLIILIVMVLVFVAVLLYQLAKNPELAARGGAAIATRGASEIAQ